MTWGNARGIDGFTAPDLHPVRPRITAYGKQTRQWREQEQIRRDPRRGLMLAVLWQSADDYHQAKKLQHKRQIRTVGQCARLPKWEREIILHGEQAFAWFTENLKEEGSGFKYSEICNYFHVSPKRLWWRIKNTPDVRLQLGYLKQGEMS